MKPKRLCVWLALSHTTCVLVVAAAAAPLPQTQPATGEVHWKTLATFAAPEAYQAAAADAKFVYAITDDKIGKYDRQTHERLALSTGDAHHLNSGFIYEGRVYCAHSNYPKTPEKSELMVLDPETMRLTTAHEFGNFGGSLTWAIHDAEGHWWCNFAKYGAKNGETFLVKFDDQWKEQQRWTYPPELIKQLGNYSLSGGVWRDGLLVVTGHTEKFIYRLRLPKEGSVVEYVDRQAVPFLGQGIADDPVTGGLVGINRDSHKVIFAVPDAAATTHPTPERAGK